MVVTFDQRTADAYYARLGPNVKYTTTTGPLQLGKRWILPCGTPMPDLTLHFNVTKPGYSSTEATIPGKILTATSWPQGDGSESERI